MSLVFDSSDDETDKFDLLQVIRDSEGEDEFGTQPPIYLLGLESQIGNWPGSSCVSQPTGILPGPTKANCEGQRTRIETQTIKNTAISDSNGKRCPSRKSKKTSLEKKKTVTFNCKLNGNYYHVSIFKRKIRKEFHFHI